MEITVDTYLWLVLAVLCGINQGGKWLGGAYDWGRWQETPDRG